MSLRACMWRSGGWAAPGRGRWCVAPARVTASASQHQQIVSDIGVIFISFSFVGYSFLCNHYSLGVYFFVIKDTQTTGIFILWDAFKAKRDKNSTKPSGIPFLPFWDKNGLFTNNSSTNISKLIHSFMLIQCRWCVAPARVTASASQHQQIVSHIHVIFISLQVYISSHLKRQCPEIWHRWQIMGSISGCWHLKGTVAWDGFLA